MYEEDKAAAGRLHSDTLTVSWENIFTSAPNGFASWTKPLNKESGGIEKSFIMVHSSLWSALAWTVISDFASCLEVVKK